MVAPSTPRDEPGAIDNDEPFDVVRANSSMGDEESYNKSKYARKIHPVVVQDEIGDLPTLSRSQSESNSNSNNHNNNHNNKNNAADHRLGEPTSLTRNVTGGQSAHTRPMSPPSRAGLDDPKTFRTKRYDDDDDEEEEDSDDDDDNENEYGVEESTIGTGTKSLGRGRSFYSEMPMDERREYEDEMKALALCDYTGEASQGMPEFCDTALTAMNEMCAGLTASSPSRRTGPEATTKKSSLKLGEKHSAANAAGAEEQTAIEVEYVEPLYRGKLPDDGDDYYSSSPKRKNAILKAMTRKAKDDFFKGKKKKGKSTTDEQQQQQQHTTTLPLPLDTSRDEIAELEEREQSKAAADNENGYATFSNIEKRKFLQLINGGTSPLNATSQVIKERSNPSNNDESVSTEGDEDDHDEDVTTKTPKKSRKLAFWKRSKKDKSKTPAVVSPTQSPKPTRPTTSNDNDNDDNDDDDDSYENVGDEIKKFLKEDREEEIAVRGTAEIMNDLDQTLQNANAAAKDYEVADDADNADNDNAEDDDADDGENSENRFEKSGISYYDAVRKDRSVDEDEYYEGGRSVSSRKQTRKLKIPKSIKGGFSKLTQRNSGARATPVLEGEDANNDEAEMEDIAETATDGQAIESHVSIPSPTKDTLRSTESEENLPHNMSKESLLDDNDEDEQQEQTHKDDLGAGDAMENDMTAKLLGLKTAEGQPIVDLNMETYLSSTETMSHVGTSRGASRSFDAVSVTSGKSGKSHRTSHTAGTNYTTQSTRSRRPGQAKVRLEKEKEALNTSGMSHRSRGWQESIEAAAVRAGKVWDPDHGWRDYVDPKNTSTASMMSGDDRVDMVIDQSAESAAEPTGETQSSPSRAVKSPARSTTPGRQKKASKMAVSPKDGRPRGWAETMKAATAKLNMEGKKWDPVRGWIGLDDDDDEAGSTVQRDLLQDVGITADSDLADFGTTSTGQSSMEQLDAIANRQDRSMQFLSEDDDHTGEEEGTTVDGDLSSTTKSTTIHSDRYVQIAESGSVQSHYRRPRPRSTVNVKKQNLNRGDADFFQDSSERRRSHGPIDLDSLHEEAEEYTTAIKDPDETVVSGPNANEHYQKIYEAQSNGSFDGATEFSWDADDVTQNAGVAQDGRKAVPRLRIKIRDSASVKSGSKPQSEASFESGASGRSIPKLAAPRKDTSPIRGTKKKSTNGSLATSSNDQDDPLKDVLRSRDDDSNANFASDGRGVVYEDDEQEAAAAATRAVEQTTPGGSRRPIVSPPSKVSELHKLWEKRTTSWDEDEHARREQEEKEKKNPEWKSFLSKKVQAERDATTRDDERDTVFDFSGGESDVNHQRSQQRRKGGRGEPEDGNAFDDISELSPIRRNDSASDYQPSETSTAVIQGTTFLQRLQACAAPVMKTGQNCTSPDGPLSAHLAFLRSNPGVGGSPDKNVANLVSRGKAGILQASAGVCGRPGVINEDDEDESTIEESIQTQSVQSRSPMQSPYQDQSSSTKSRSRSNPRSRQSNKDDLSSVISDGFGAKSAYLEAIAMKAAVSGGSKKKKRRSQGSEVSAATSTQSSRQSPGSNVSASGNPNSKHSEKFQQFLDRRATKEDAVSPTDKKPPTGRSEVSSRAEKYASEKVNDMMDTMAGRKDMRGRAREDYEKTGAFPTLPGSAAPNRGDSALQAAEELAAARVEVMMQRLSAQNLEDHEVEI